MRPKVRDQRIAIRRPALVVADRVDVEHRIADPIPAHKLPRERDHLQVCFGTRKPETLDAELVRLPVAPFLRALVAKDRSDVIQPQRPERKKAAFQGGPDHRRRPFRAKRQTTAGAVVEGVHLFFHDVGLRADTSDEELGRLEDRRANLAVAKTLREKMYPRFERVPPPRLGRNEVLGAARGAKVLWHARPTGSPGRLTSHCARARDGRRCVSRSTQRRYWPWQRSSHRRPCAARWRRRRALFLKPHHSYSPASLRGASYAIITRSRTSVAAARPARRRVRFPPPPRRGCSSGRSSPSRASPPRSWLRACSATKAGSAARIPGICSVILPLCFPRHCSPALRRRPPQQSIRQSCRRYSAPRPARCSVLRRRRAGWARSRWPGLCASRLRSPPRPSSASPESSICARSRGARTPKTATMRWPICSWSQHLQSSRSGGETRSSIPQSRRF